MARFQSDVLGKFRGKVGSIVGTKWKGDDVIRGKGPSTRNNNSPLQIEQQAKFRLATNFVNQMHDLFSITFKNYEKRMTARNNAMQITIKDAITGIYPDYALDYSKILISRGSLRTEPVPPVTTMEAGIVKWKWDYASNKFGNAKDRTILVAYCLEYEHVLFEAFGPSRETGEATLNVNVYAGKTVVTWMAFISEDTKKLSNSLFTGQFTVPAPVI